MVLAGKLTNGRIATRCVRGRSGGGVRQAATGISKIDELVNTFIDAEDQNFSLFNYVNELNNEVPSTRARPQYPTML